MDAVARAQRIELRAVIASKQGLSCEGYYGLSNCTSHLRERLYVSVADGDKLFLPLEGPGPPFEHFPCAEIEDYYVRRARLGLNQSIGAGGGEVVFALEGPAADEGAIVLTRELVKLEPIISQGLLGRWISAIPERHRHKFFEEQFKRGVVGPAYRPEVLPVRPQGAPGEDPLPEGERWRRKYAMTINERIEARTREILKGWGMESAHDDMLKRRSRGESGR